VDDRSDTVRREGGGVVGVLNTQTFNASVFYASSLAFACRGRLRRR
jgi:hypothetical protein